MFVYGTHIVACTLLVVRLQRNQCACYNNWRYGFILCGRGKDMNNWQNWHDVRHYEEHIVEWAVYGGKEWCTALG